MKREARMEVSLCVSMFIFSTFQRSFKFFVKLFQIRKEVRVPKFLFQIPEIAEVRIPFIILGVLHCLVQHFEFGHTVVECPHILIQTVEYLLLDELIETGLIEVVAYNERILEKVIEEGRELQLVVHVLAEPRTVDIHPIEALSNLFLIQHGFEEVDFLPYPDRYRGCNKKPFEKILEIPLEKILEKLFDSL